MNPTAAPGGLDGTLFAPSPPGTDDEAEAPATIFASTADWMSGWLQRFATRPALWCDHWAAHPDAASRLHDLWQAWEVAVAEGGTAMSSWWLLHFDGHAAALDGPIHPDVLMPAAHTPPPTPRSTPWWVWLLLAATVGIVAATGIYITRQLTPPTEVAPSTTIPAPVTVPVAGIILTGDQLGLGPITGTILIDDETVTDGLPVAYPGQPVTAPTPPDGAAVAWQWELCDAAAAGPADCTPIGGATTNLWASPPTPTPAVIRVVVTVDLDGAQIRAASAPFVALPWPDGVTPGATPTTIPVSSTTVVPSTTTAVNAYGDPLGPITNPAGPEAAFALAVAAQTVDGPAVASNRMAVLAHWVALTTPTSEPGTVTATAVGYVVSVDDTTLTLTDFVVTDNVATDLRVCVNDGACRYASDITDITDACQSGTTRCPTITSADGGLTALRRGIITIDDAPHLLYETIGTRPVASISHDSGTVHYNGGWFLIDLPTTPPPGATQPLTVTYTDGGTDTLTVTY